jgi:hypothetical protein
MLFTNLRRHFDKDLRTDPILKPLNIGFITIFYIDAAALLFSQTCPRVVLFSKDRVAVCEVQIMSNGRRRFPPTPFVDFERL